MLIGYARVSTADQSHNLQADALTAAGCTKIAKEIASGAADARPMLARALGSCQEGDTLVVWKLDRLGRNLRRTVDLVEDLAARGIGFKSLTDNIDTTTPAGRFFFHIMAALAEMERDLIRERVMAGLQASRARGRRGGRRHALTPSQVEHARKLVADGSVSYAEAARTLGVSRSTLYRSLASQTA